MWKGTLRSLLDSSAGTAHTTCSMAAAALQQSLSLPQVCKLSEPCLR